MTQDNRIITLEHGACRIDLWSIGARLNGVAWGEHSELVNGASSPDEARGAKTNHGCVVAPVANRIAGSTFELDGVTYSLSPNEPGDTICHSGDASLRDKVWTVEHEDARSVVFAADVANMADGFPGNRTFRAVYEMQDGGFDVRFSAETDRPTVVNMALHPYWSLAGRGRAGQSLMVAADHYLPIDALKIPTGEIAPVDGTIFDLREVQVPSTEIDHNFCLTPGDMDAPSARVETDTGLVLDILTDAPGLQVFTGKDFGIAIEPQHWPDTVHHPAFPPIRLEPGETYAQTTRYRFSTR